jgi:DNA invertase Pin-like site-specific DNA recombinase
LLSIIDEEDYIIIRSVADLTYDAKELLAILKALQERQVTMISILEPFLSGKEYHTAMKGFVDVHKTFLERKRRQGYMKQRKPEQ